MRHIIVIIIVTLVSFITSAELKAQEKAENQGFRFSGISFSAGEGMVSSGLYATISASSSKMLVEATAAGDQAYVNTFWRVGDKLLIGPSMGHKDNTPFLGGIALFQPTKYLSTFHWFAYTAGELGAETINFNESAFAFMANQISLKVKRVSLNYSLVHFLKYEPMHGIGIRYNQPLGDEVLIYGDATYKVGQKMLFQIGMTWKRK